MAENDSIEINTAGVKKNWEKATYFLRKKNVQVAITIILFALILFSSVSTRLSGLPNLVDQTTGHYVFADPDAFYEYRVAQTILNTSNINGIDAMRDPGLNLPYTKEMLPIALADAYRILHPLNSTLTLDYIDVIYPIIAFALSLIVFFVLCWYLSKSKFLALLASLMLAYSTTYLQRTGAGISSHEALGMIFVFLTYLIYAFSMNNYKKNWKWAISLGIITGIVLAFSLFAWSGGSSFALMILPLASLVYYLFGTEDKELKKKFIWFNILWIFSSIAMMPILGYSISDMASRLFSNYGIIGPFAIVFMIVDLYIDKNSHKIKIGQSKNRIWYSLAITIAIGLIGLIAIGKNPINLISGIYNQLFFPFGQDRAALTVAYYAQPYLTDLINQIGSSMFWVFFLGIIFIGLEFGKRINNKKDRFYFYLVWILTTSGMLFSRISSSSFLNGTNFISRTIYVLSFLVLGFYFVWLYKKEKFVIDTEIILLFSWMIVTLVSVRSAIRVMFVVVTFVFAVVGFFIMKSYEYGKRTNNSNLKYLLFGLSILALLISLTFVFGNPLTGNSGSYQATSDFSAHDGPITGAQWQNSMAWVRNNTALNSVFISWWDYGYLIQTLGGRATVVDGGNSNVYWDHMVGRYLLTETNTNASLSFMKTHNVSYLLIDPTDVGKYPAYSSIGSDATGNDRLSQIPIMVSDPTQTSETSSGEIRVYTGASPVDQDIVYQNTNGTVFIPSQASALIGIIMTVNKTSSSFTINQPYAIFYYNNQQIRIPVRYVYYNGKLVDFGGGLNSTVRIIPALGISGQSLQVDQLGALMYLSSKTYQSLFAELYLLDDAFNRYPTIKLANSQPDPIVASINSQGTNVGNIIYYQGFHGPLDIWQVNYPSSIRTNPQFLSPSGAYAAFDNLTFTN